MSVKYLDSNGLLYLWSKLKVMFAGKVATIRYDSNKIQKSNDGTTFSDVVSASDLVADGGGVKNLVLNGATLTPTSNSIDLGNLKTQQTAKTDPSAEGNSLTFIDTLTQNANGEVTATKKTVYAAAPYVDAENVGQDGLLSANDKAKLNGVSAEAKKVESSLTNGNIKIDGVETTVYSLPSTVVQTVEGLVPAELLPSFVDDVIEAYPVSGATKLTAGWLSKTNGGTAFTPETGKIYVLMVDYTETVSGESVVVYAANTQFRWGGTAYVKLNDGGVSSITNAEIDTILAA